jgi:hypothetical protein
VSVGVSVGDVVSVKVGVAVYVGVGVKVSVGVSDDTVFVKVGVFVLV